MDTGTLFTRRTRCAALAALGLAFALAGITGLAHADALSGPVCLTDTVPPGGSRTEFVAFTGGAWAVIEAASSEPGALDLRLYDGHGTLVSGGADSDGDGVTECVWLVPQTEQYTIRIVNRSRHDVDYRLLTN